MSPALGQRRIRLAVLAAALFVYLTCELFPVGAQPQLARGLHTSPSGVGLLLTAYAMVAGLVTLPSVRLTRWLSHRDLLVAAMAVLAVGQGGLALADGPVTAVACRAAAALGHGLVWSQSTVLAVAFAPVGHSGRATAIVFLGSSLGLLVGAPVSAALAGTFGWRTGALALGGAALVVMVLLRVVLPARMPAAAAPVPATGPAPRRAAAVTVVCLATVVLVVGHYVSYGYLEPIAALAGLAGPWLAPVLAGYGAAGLLGVLVTGRGLDRWPHPTTAAVCAALTLAVAGLTLTRATGVAAGLIAVWGAAAAALPVVLNSAVLRVAGTGRDAASGAYVVAYQIGISAGAALGGLLLTERSAAALPACSALVLATGTALVLGTPGCWGRQRRAGDRTFTGRRITGVVAPPGRARPVDHPDRGN
jgi:predicted MFS family arabinose efflux permease